MNNQDFLYFDWGTHDDSTQDFYGLADLMSRQIYLVHQNYQLLKLIQFITLTSKHLILFPLCNADNYTPGLIDNSVCLAWQFNSIKPFNDLSTGFAGTYRNSFPVVLKSHIIPPTIKDIEIQKNLFLILKILTTTDVFIKNQCKSQIDLDHYIELSNFCKIILPDDYSIIELINIDQNLTANLKNKIENCKHIIIKILSNLDYIQDYKTVYLEFNKNIELIDKHTIIENNYKNYLLRELS